MANLFKTIFALNFDGTNSSIIITNENTVFVHTYIGDDFSGDGTREYPFKSAFKANQKSGVTYLVFRGVINESVSINKKVIGDDINQQIAMTNYLIDLSNNNYRLTMDTDGPNGFHSQGVSYTMSIITNGKVDVMNYFNTLIKNYVTGYYNNYSSLDQCTIVNFDYKWKYSQFTNNTPAKNMLICGIVNLHDTSACPLYTIFSSQCYFKYNGVDIIQPIWTNDSKANMQLLRDGYLVAGMPQVYVDSLFLKDSFNNETCRIILEERNGGTSANIFNRYNSDGSVIDYTLNPASNNEALYASDLGGYVGCFGPANAILPTDLDTPINVNTDGSDDIINPATLLRGNIDNTFDFDISSAQTWNRMRSHTTINIPNGVKFRGSESMEDDGSAFGYYFGKQQNLISDIIINPGDILEPNTLYKVCNPNKDIFSAILYNGTQYLPDYFFKTGTDILIFSLLNIGSGTILRKVLAVPFESEEIIPYDGPNTPSLTFPKFSCPFFGDVLMLFHKIGDRINLPVLFSEVPNDKISYYSNYAVTNADQEFVNLSTDVINYYYKIPTLKYLRIELNAHYNAYYE